MFKRTNRNCRYLKAYFNPETYDKILQLGIHREK